MEEGDFEATNLLKIRVLLLITHSLFYFSGTPVNIIEGSHVWAEDSDLAWVDGQVVKINGQDVEIEASNGKKAPRTSRASLVKGSSRSVANTAAQQALIAHWQGIVKRKSRAPFLVRKIFTQIFSFINVQLFNSLLLRRECCSFSNGEYVKAGLAEHEHWCYTATEEYAGAAWEELKHIRQAIGFLVLSIQQLYRIGTMYWDDKYGTHSVSPEVISNMRVLMTEDSNHAVSNSFLLDDDSSIPFSVDDISKSMNKIDITDVEPPPLIREISGLSFLLPRAD